MAPVFAASFTPGQGGVTLIRAETFTDFNAQIAALTNSRLTCMSTLQSLNRTWFYAALSPSSGDYYLFRTADPIQFQQAFTQRQGTWTLIDFNAAWELGQIYYTGYWLKTSPAPNQKLLFGLSFDDLAGQWRDLSGNQGFRMTRVQAWPQLDVAAFAALFEAGSGAYVLYDEPLGAFSVDVAGRFSGSTLIGLDFDPVTGYMVGCWRDKLTPSSFSFNLDWDSLNIAARQAGSTGMTMRALTAYPSAPSFEDYLVANLAPFTAGYGWAVAKDGQIIGSGGGYGRLAQEKQNPNLPFTADTRLNLASVSKAITGITLEVLCVQYPISLDEPFWPFIQAKVPSPDASIKKITLRNLATMKSGMTQEFNEGPISPPNGDFWSYLKTYLSNPLVGTPGVTYYYDNTNFSILQGVIEQVSGLSYVDFATRNVLMPAGIDPRILSTTPDPSATAALTYTGPTDARAGYYWPPIGFVAPAGWISSARELVKLAAAMRGTSVLPAAVVSEMFNDGIGWYPAAGNFGTYYQHNGSIGNGQTPAQRLNTGLIRLGEGYDMALLSNCVAPVDVINLCVGAFDSRGVPLISTPTTAPALTTIVHAATFGLRVAPGAYAAATGTGFSTASQDWTAAIGTGAALPQEVAGVRVRVGAQDAYVEYVSPTQINFLLPQSTLPGTVLVQVTTQYGGVEADLTIDAVAPGLFAYTLAGSLYPVALYANTTTYVAAPGAFPGGQSRAAAAGDLLVLYGSGMGPTNPVAPDGVVLRSVYPASDLSTFRVSIAGQAVPILFAGIVAAGLFQLNIQIPRGLPGGDQPFNLTVSGVTAQPNLRMTMLGG